VRFVLGYDANPTFVARAERNHFRDYAESYVQHWLLISARIIRHGGRSIVRLLCVAP
jgi:hypothetical protein